MSGFIYLGASRFALDALEEILSVTKQPILCLIDSEMTEHKINLITKRFPNQNLEEKIFDSLLLKDATFINFLSTLEPSFAMSVHFSDILKKDFISIPKYGVGNIHASYLPYNRGHWPEIWSIYNNQTAGVTIHYIEEGIDTGSIIAQRKVKILPEDTSETLYKKIEIYGLELLRSNWNNMVSGKSTSSKQKEKYALNQAKDIESISEILLDKTYSGYEIINQIRALTIPSYLKGAYFKDPKTGEKIRVRIVLERDKN